jgi:hypothetical protein
MPALPHESVTALAHNANFYRIPHTGATLMPSKSTGTKAATRPTKRRANSRPKKVALSSELREEMIREAAYFRAEKRGFEGGDPLADWLSSEQEVDTALSKGAH